MSMGCPKSHKDVPISQVSNKELVKGTSGVRCCSTDGKKCSTTGTCHYDKTYEEAEEICAAKGMRLCFAHEVDKCCENGCYIDDLLMWIAEIEPKGALTIFI